MLIPTSTDHDFSLQTSNKLWARSEEHTSELQSQSNLVCRLLLEKKKHFSTHGINCPWIAAPTTTFGSSQPLHLHITSLRWATSVHLSSTPVYFGWARDLYEGS